MRYRLLGPVEVWRDGESVVVEGRKQRTVLALLLLEAGRMVPLDRMFRALWGERLPKTARAQLHNHVSALRRVLGVAVHGGPEGYRLDLAADELDLAEFDAVVAAARSALSDGDDAGATDLLRSGLRLWSEPVLGGVTDELRQMVVPGLIERRLTALCDRIDADLRLARHADLVGELRQLTDEHPLDDRFPLRLMLALHRTGRQADALRAYDEHRRRRRDELGLDPTSAMRDLHRTILTEDLPPERTPTAEGPAPTLTVGVLGPVEAHGPCGVSKVGHMV